jgi:hypothetical protein
MNLAQLLFRTFMLLVLIGTLAMLLFSAKSYTVEDQDLRSTVFFNRIVNHLAYSQAMQTNDGYFASKLTSEDLHTVIGGNEKTKSLAIKATLTRLDVVSQESSLADSDLSNNPTIQNNNYDQNNILIAQAYFNEDVFKLYEPLTGIRKSRYKEVTREYYMYLVDEGVNAKLSVVFVYALR